MKYATCMLFSRLTHILRVIIDYYIYIITIIDITYKDLCVPVNVLVTYVPTSLAA